MKTPRTVLITGASRGIGAAVARRVARIGADVLLASRNVEACFAVAAEIKAAGGHAEAIAMDVGDPASIAQAMEEGRRKVGPIEGLVSNAGIAISAPLGGGGPEDLYEKHMQVNFHGARRVIEALLPEMKSRGFGRIAVVNSSAGLHGYKYVSAYCASKHALLGYVRAAAAELAGTNITISTVCPHYVDSPMTDASVQRMVERTHKSEKEIRTFLAGQNPGGRMLTVDEVAESVAYLLESERNGWVVELDGRSPKVVEKL